MKNLVASNYRSGMAWEDLYKGNYRSNINVIVVFKPKDLLVLYDIVPIFIDNISNLVVSYNKNKSIVVELTSEFDFIILSKVAEAAKEQFNLQYI